MEFSIKTLVPEKSHSRCVVVAVYEDGLSPAAAALDQASEGYLSSLLQAGDLKAKVGQTLLVHRVANVAAERILLVGAGKKESVDDKQFRDVVTAALRTLKTYRQSEVACYLLEIAVKKRDTAWQASQIAQLAEDAQYQYSGYKKHPSPIDSELKALTLVIRDTDDPTELQQALNHGQATARGMAEMRNLANTPANYCTPSDLAQRATQLAEQYAAISVEILERDALADLGMGSFLSVAAGSDQAPKLIVLHYQGASSKQKPIVLVGKGVTFDTGGISLKPAAKMDEMKFDMSGAASVLGTLVAVAEMQLALNVSVIIPATENMPNGKATKPGDVVTSLSGQTIEILNTDAEGRLILCDALTYAARFKPAMVIDVATLTGACVVSLGKVASGLMGNDEALLEALENAGKRSLDRVWRLPLWEEYDEQLDSAVADIANIGTPGEAGTITAGCFLARFTKEYRWAHLDIAGTAYQSGKNSSSTGRPVPLLTQFLLAQAPTRAKKKKKK